MMKRVISLMLALLAVVMALASCSTDNDVGDITDTASRYTTTLNMWVMTESTLVAEAGQRVRDGVTPEDVPGDEVDPAEAAANGWSEEQKEAFLQVYAIQEAVNKITKAKFKTQLNLVYITEDQYYAKLEAAFAEHERVKAESSAKDETETDTETDEETEEEVEEETVIIDGIPQLKYPEIPDYMVDIYFLNGFETYRSYINKGWTVQMDTLLQSSATEISKYINKIFLDGAKSTSVTHAIPNYHPIGEYTYLMVDADLLADYARNVEDLSNNSIYSSECRAFLDYIYERRQLTGEDIYPIYTDDANGEVAFSPVHYWSHDLDSVAGACQVQGDVFSLFGNVYANTDAWGRPISYSNLLANKTYMDNLATKKYYENTVDYVTTDPEAKAAVHVVSGGWGLREEYAEKGYTALVMESPRATTETIFESMFAIGGYSEYPERAMEVISLINTNAELRNIIQYGIENVNYTVHTVGEGEGDDYQEYTYIVPTEENFYEMDLLKTGNTMIAYPMFERDEAANVTAKAVKERSLYLQLQNLDATTDPTMCVWYNLGDTTYALDEESVRVINAVSAKLGAYLDSLTTASSVQAIYSKVGAYNEAQMADYLLTLVGRDVTYTFKNETKTVTAENLAAALKRMADNTLTDAGDDKKESPNAYYQNWLASANIPK